MLQVPELGKAGWLLAEKNILLKNVVAKNGIYKTLEHFCVCTQLSHIGKSVF